MPLRGAFVYRLGHGPLKAERRVRFPYALPLQHVRLAWLTLILLLAGWCISTAAFNALNHGDGLFGGGEAVAQVAAADGSDALQ